MNFPSAVQKDSVYVRGHRRKPPAKHKITVTEKHKIKIEGPADLKSKLGEIAGQVAKRRYQPGLKPKG